MKTIRHAVAVLGLFFGFAVSSAQAHPCLSGLWSAPLPCGGKTSYLFSPAEDLGGGLWYGCLIKTVSGQTITKGTYELRMWSATEGTVSIREGMGISTIVGTVDFATGKFDYLASTYRK
ncbi:MAG: hypothetical protein EBV06_11825 [Planctomycetia bacterium]|nr:hypothetical protein [Planctomycetia bacterium]